MVDLHVLEGCEEGKAKAPSAGRWRRLVDAPPEGEVFDFQCALMSLPRSFGTSCENLSSNVPYLFAEEALVVRWRERLTTACNSCHAAAHVSFIKVRGPTASPFSNQFFPPERK